jgi:hypothetical protein
MTMVGVLSPGLGREQQDPHEEEDHTRDEDRRGWSPRPRLHVTAVPVVRGRGPGGDRPRVTRTGTDASRELTRPWVTRRSRVVRTMWPSVHRVRPSRAPITSSDNPVADTPGEPACVSG